MVIPSTREAPYAPEVFYGCILAFNVSQERPYLYHIQDRPRYTPPVSSGRIGFTVFLTYLMLETAQILTNRTEEAEIIVTLAQNGGLQIKSRL
jgi:hypothetical protein